MQDNYTIFIIARCKFDLNSAPMLVQELPTVSRVACTHCFSRSTLIVNFDFEMPDTELNSSMNINENQEESIEIKDEAMSNDFATPEKQEARSFLRERFLRVITGIVGKPAQFHLYENTNVSAEFRGCDINFLELYVRNLTTPLGTIPEAILRTNDVILLEMEKI